MLKTILFWHYGTCVCSRKNSLILLPERDYVSYIRFFAIANPSVCRLSVCRLSVCCLSVCNDGAPYSGGWTFRQFYFTPVYAGHPLTSVQNFAGLSQGKPSVGRVKRKRGIKIERRWTYQRLRCKIRPQLLLTTNRKWREEFIGVTFNDLDPTTTRISRSPEFSVVNSTEIAQNLSHRAHLTYFIRTWLRNVPVFAITNPSVKSQNVIPWFLTSSLISSSRRCWLGKSSAWNESSSLSRCKASWDLWQSSALRCTKPRNCMASAMHCSYYNVQYTSWRYQSINQSIFRVA